MIGLSWQEILTIASVQMPIQNVLYGICHDTSHVSFTIEANSVARLSSIYTHWASLILLILLVVNLHLSGIGIFLTIDLILRLRWDPAQMLPRSTECLEGRGVLLTRIQWNIKSTPELHHSATNSACTHALKKVESQRPSTSPRRGWNRLGVVNTIKLHTGIPGRRFQHVWSQNVLRWYAGNCHI